MDVQNQSAASNAVLKVGICDKMFYYFFFIVDGICGFGFVCLLRCANAGFPNLGAGWGSIWEEKIIISQVSK